MSYYGLADSTSLSSFFGTSTSSSSSSFSSLLGSTSSSDTSILSDYASLQNGSYYKLMKAYYNNEDSSTSISGDTTKELTTVQSSAERLKEAAEALYKQGSDSVFKKVTTENEDGSSTTDYDVDAIYQKVSAFIESYNDMMDSTDDISTTSISNKVSSLTSTTNTQAKLLASVGISINSDGTLSVDEDAFKESDMSTVKTLFNGTGSYAYQVATKASMIGYTTQQEATKANTYTQYGSYSYNYSSSYSSLV